MAIVSLHTTQTPTGTDNTDGTPGITTGTTFYVDSAGYVYGIRFYSTVSIAGNYTAALYTVDNTDNGVGAGTGTLLASKTTSGVVASGTWNTILFDTPVAISAGGVYYRAALFNDTGRYVNTAHVYDTGGIDNGIIHAPATSTAYGTGGGTVSQATFTINASLAYPTSAFNANDYFTDVLFGAGALQPQLIAQYDVPSGGNNSSTLTTPSFAPGPGELLVVKMNTWDTGTAMGAPSGGSLTWASRVIGAPGGFHGYCAIYSSLIGSTSPGSMTVSATPAASCRHNLVVERWAGAQLAASPATDAGAGSPTSTLTTTAANSAITWVGVDESSIDPATRAYAGGAVEEYVDDGHVGANSVAYYAYQAVASAGATTYGLTAPSGVGMNFAALELQPLGFTPSGGSPVRGNSINNGAALARAFNW